MEGVSAVPIIAFIIGDCKGNDLLCLQKGGHHLKMKGLCRDCNIVPDDRDNTCIGGPLVCQFLKKSDIVGKTERELAEISFLYGTNNIHSLSFGGGDHNICSARSLRVYIRKHGPLLHKIITCDYKQSCFEKC